MSKYLKTYNYEEKMPYNKIYPDQNYCGTYTTFSYHSKKRLLVVPFNFL